MKAILVCFLLLAVLATVYSEPQFYNSPTNSGVDYFRSSFQRPSGIEGRIFLGTRTVTLSTFTSTLTSTTTTFCTTSTAALSACVASGGRRRRNSDAGALFYNEESESSYLPSLEKRSVEEQAPAQPDAPPQAPVFLPFVVEPGMARSANLHPQARFLLALTTFTTTLTTTSVSISTLTAICSSSTSFQLCGSSGK